MNIVVIDGQGGGVGRQLVAALQKARPGARIWAVGTNAVATAQMLKAGADAASTGENAVVVACRTADVVAGPVGIVVADALLGEVTPQMARAVGASAAVKVLIPMNMCEIIVAGVEESNPSALISQAAVKICAMLARGGNGGGEARV